MTLPMDVRLAAEDARIGFVFARRGIVPEASSSWFLPRVVGISRSMEWVATGVIALGVLMLLQPFWLVLYTWSFLTTLAGTALFMVVSKFPE